MDACDHADDAVGRRLGVHSGALANPASIAAAVKLVLSDEARIPDLTVQPKDGPLPWGAGLHYDLKQG